MNQPTAAPAPRVVSLVIVDDDPASLLAELLNSLDEDVERNVLDFITSPEFALFVACREIEVAA